MFTINSELGPFLIWIFIKYITNFDLGGTVLIYLFGKCTVLIYDKSWKEIRTYIYNQQRILF